MEVAKTDPTVAARRSIVALIEDNGFAQDRAKRMTNVQLEELLRLRENRKTLLALLKAAGGDPAEYEMREEALA